MTNEELLRQDVEYHQGEAGEWERSAQQCEKMGEPEMAAGRRRVSLRHLQTATAIKEALLNKTGVASREPTGEEELE